MNIKQSIRHSVVVAFVTTATILVTTPASARDQVPFRGTVSGSVTSVTPLDECNQLIEAVNGGNATHLGRFTGTAEFVLDVCNLTYVGSYVFTAANGDSISGPFIGSLTPTAVQGVFDNTESALITGGTGRFRGATGSFNLGGQINLNTGTFSLPFEGTISSVGSRSRSATINFDAIDASANPVGGATLDTYLAQYGVTISGVTPGSQVVVDDDRRSYGGGVVFASSPHNFLSDYFLNAPNSFTLNFTRPADSVNFTRIAGGPFPTIYASWTATAVSASGQVLSSVSESSPGYANFPPHVFTLTGPGIAKVRWDSDGFGIAAFSAVLFDDLVLNY